MGKFVVMPPRGVQLEVNEDGTPVYKDARDATQWRVVNKLTGDYVYASTEEEAQRKADELNRD